MDIRDKISKPSEALQAMVDGLRTQSGRKDFEVNMLTFGNSIGPVCFGCAATCAIQQIAGKNFPPEVIHDWEKRVKFLGTTEESIDLFEGAINAARLGDLEDLFEYFEFDVDNAHQYEGRFTLHNGDWEEQLPRVEELIAEMQKEGF